LPLKLFVTCFWEREMSTRGYSVLTGINLLWHNFVQNTAVNHQQ
jgi:hypothetical protein